MPDLAVESIRTMKSSQAPPPAQACAWFKRNDAFPLLKDRTIINFMSAYIEQHWPEVRCVHAVYSRCTIRFLLV